MDRQSELRLCVDACGLRRFLSLLFERLLGLFRCGLDMDLVLSVGMGSVPLRPLDARSFLRLGLGSRLLLGSRLGGVEKWRRILRLGANGPRHGRYFHLLRPARELDIR